MILRIIGILLLALVVAAVITMVVIPAMENVDRTQIEGSADWMAALYDGTIINEVILPGTHDSATKNVQLGYFSKCQALSIAEQLEAGFRYLDIRLAVDGSRMKFMHGFTTCTVGIMPWSETLYLDSVLNDCYAFLSEHPTEFVVFAVKQEHGDESVSDFETALNEEIAKNSEYWALTDTLPSVGEARGKLVLMRRYHDEAELGQSAGIALLWADQGNREDFTLNIAEEENDSFTLWVQDRFKYDEADKWSAFLTGLNAGNAGENALFLHFLSTNGNTSYGHPYRYAQELNRKLQNVQPALNGWVIVDFASPAIAEQIYSANF